MAHPVYTDVTNAVRAYLNDLSVPGGATYDDTFLQSYVYLAQQTLVNYLIANSVRQTNMRTYFTVIAAATSGPVVLQYIDSPSLTPLGVQTLANPSILGTTSWAAAGDFSLPTGTGAAYADASHAGTLTQTVANMTVAPVGSATYAFTYTVTAVTGFTGTVTITNAFASASTTLPISLGVNTVYFTSAVTPGNIVISVTSSAGSFSIGQFNLSQASNVQNCLPANLIIPDQLFERQPGGLESDFVSMTGPADLPRINQVSTLGYWDWQGGQVMLVGATQNREVRMDYWADLGALKTGSSQQAIVTSGNALALLTACYAARARGQGELAAQFATFGADGSIGGQAGWEIQQIISAEIRSQQSQPVRRQPMFGRDRYSNQTGWTRWR